MKTGLINLVALVMTSIAVGHYATEKKMFMLAFFAAFMLANLYFVWSLLP